MHPCQRVDDDRDDREEEGDGDYRHRPEAEPDDDQRIECDERRRIEKPNEGIDRIFENAAHPHGYPEGHAEDERDPEAQCEFGEAHGKVAQQRARLPLRREGRGDERWARGDGAG